MSMIRNIILLFLAMAAVQLQAQDVIRLYTGKAPGSEKWDWQEGEYFQQMTKQRMVYNVVDPTLTVFKPAAGKANGTAVIVAPGGGWHVLSIDYEGNLVAKWLAERGVTAFVLKYRMARTFTKDPFMELFGGQKSPAYMDSVITNIGGMGIADGLEAVKYVRNNAGKYGIDPKKIGFMGFSAGGHVTLGVATKYQAESRPDFVAPIYAYTGGKSIAVPNDAPPMFLVAATNDGLQLASHSVQLYTDWLQAKKPVELHMYEKGDHGFGMREQGIPTDTWIERMGEWMTLHGWMPKKK